MRNKFIHPLKISLAVALATAMLSTGTYSCTKRRAPSPMQQAEPISGQLTPPQPNLVQRVLGLVRPVALPVEVSQFAGKLKIGKGAQVTIITSKGDDNDIKPTQGKIDKNKAAAQVATDSSTLNAAQLKGNGQLTQVPGDNNDVKPTLEQAKETHWYDQLLTPVGYGLGAVVFLVLIGGIFWLRNKKRQVSTVTDILT